MNDANLPTYIPLKEAAKKYNLTTEGLLQAIDEEFIEAAKIGDAIVVADKDVMMVAAQMSVRDKDDELVSLSEAARRLDIQMRTISRWEDYGWLPVIALGPRRAKLVSWKQAKALGDLHKRNSQRGSRLIPHDKEIIDISTR